MYSKSESDTEEEEFTRRYFSRRMLSESKNPFYDTI